MSFGESTVSRNYFVRWGAALLMGIALGCSTAPIYNVSNEPLGRVQSLDVAGVRIERAARLQGWTTERVAEDEIIITRSKGRHTAAATIIYDLSSFDIQLRNSSDFKQRNGHIHKLYNDWIVSLRDTILAEIAARN